MWLLEKYSAFRFQSMSADGIEQNSFGFFNVLFTKSYFRNHLNAACSVFHSHQTEILSERVTCI